MSNVPNLLSPFVEFVNSTVSGGYVLALATICALQYVLHFSRISRAERKAAVWREQSEHLTRELESVERDHSRSQLEHSALREFLSEKDLDRAVDQLLKRFIPAAKEGFAAFVECSAGQSAVFQSRGLSEESRRELRIPPRLYEWVERERIVVLDGRALYDAGLLETLALGDRAKVRRLFLFAAGPAGESQCLFMTTHLIPRNLPFDDQLEFVRNHLVSISSLVLRAQSLDRQEYELRATNDRMELQSIIDRHIDQPEQLLEAYLELLIEKLGCDRGLIALSLAGDCGSERMVVRTGQTLPGTLVSAWEESEERLLQAARGKSEPLVLDASSLEVLGIRTLVSSALVLPLPRTPRTGGVVCFTRRSGRPLGESHLPLAEWAAHLLSGSLERVLSRAVIERQARQDGLTSLANRRTFDQQLAREIEQANRSGGECSLLLLDLDRFKSINDTYGHLAGDEVLRETARVLEEELLKLRSGDRAMLARYGGEEMALLLPGIGTAGALRIGECMRRAVESAIITHDGRPLQVTLSAGVATYPMHAANAQSLIAAADAGLYQAKQSGRNQVTCAIAELV